MRSWQEYKQQFWDVLGREWYALWRKPRPMALIFLTPLVFGVLFGLVYLNNVVEHIPMAVYDEDQSSLSRKLIQVYGDTQRFAIVAYPSTPEELQQLLAEEKVQVAVEIPENFSKDIKSGRGTEVAVTINSANNIVGNSALSSFEEDNRVFNVSVAQQLLEAYGIKPQEALNAAYPVRLGTRILHNPVIGYINFMVPGLVLHGLQIALLLTIAPFLTSILRRKIYGPKYAAGVLITAKSLPYFFLGIVAFILGILELNYFFAVPMRGSWLELIVLIMSFIFAFMSVLFVVSTISPNEIMSVQIPLLYIMPSLMYSGFSWPIISMNGFASVYAHSMPLTYAVDNMRDIMLQGYAPALWQDIGILLGIGVVCSTLAGIIFNLRRRFTQKAREKEWKEEAAYEAD